MLVIELLLTEPSAVVSKLTLLAKVLMLLAEVMLIAKLAMFVFAETSLAYNILTVVMFVVKL